MPTKPTSDQVCGVGAKYEPSRTNAKYGYCKPRERLAEKARNRTTGRLTDVTTPCFMVHWPSGSSRGTPVVQTTALWRE